jgi:signal peptidase I
MRSAQLCASSLLGIIAVVGWLLFLRPVALGGSASYMLVSGHSMEPSMHTGDLAVLQRQTHYAIGDVVAFPVQQGALVIHRIVGGDGARGFIMQGDNKDAPDDWQPADAEILGKLWLRIPGAGRAVGALRESPYLPIALGLMGLSFLLADERQRNKRRGNEIEHTWAAIPHRHKAGLVERAASRLKRLIRPDLATADASISRLGPMLVTVSDVSATSIVHRVHVDSLEEIERAARIANQPILLCKHAAAHEYIVVSGEILYSFVPSSIARGSQASIQRIAQTAALAER